MEELSAHIYRGSLIGRAQPQRNDALAGGGGPLEDSRCYQGLGNTVDRNYLEIMSYSWKLCSEMR